MAKKNVEERFNAALEQYRNPQDTIDSSRAAEFARQVESFSNDLSSGKLSSGQIEEQQKQLSAQAESLANWASQNRNSLNASFEGIGKTLGVWNDISSSIDKYRSSPLPNYGWNREAPEAIQAMQTGTIGETPDVLALRDAASRLALGGADSAFKPYEDFYKMKNTPLDVAVSRADDFKRLAEYQSRANGLDGNTRYSSLTREEFQDYTALMDKYHLDTDSLRNMPFDKMAAGYAQQAVQSKQYNTNEEMTAAARSDKDFEKISATGLKMMESGGALGDYNDRMSVGNSYDAQLKYMTDEQKAIYAYYLAKGAAWQPDGSGSLSYDERRKEADRYYHTIAEDIAYRAARDAVNERHQPGTIDWGTVLNSGNPVSMLMNSARITNMAIAQLQGAQGGKENASAQALEAAEKVDYLGDLFNTSVGNAFQNIGAGFVTAFGGKNNEDYYTPTPSNLDIQRGLLYEKYTGDSKVRKVVADLVMNTGNMAPQILATTIATLATGGMAAAGGAAALAAHGINTAASIATMGMQVYGESYDEGRRMGMDTNQAGVYGLLNAGSELALGEIMGIAGRAGGTVLSRGLQRIAPNIDNAVTAVASKVGKTAWGRYLANVAGEGLEEYMQDVLEPWFRALATGGESENLDFLSADALYSGLIGMLSAGFMDINGVADIGQEITLYKDAGAQIKSAGTVGQLKSIASTFSADTKAYQLAEKLTEDSKPSEIGKALKAVGAALSDQNAASMSAYLQEKYKLPKDSADKLIGFFRDYCNGEELSSEGLELLDVNDEITEAFLAEIIDANVSDARKNTALQALAQNTNFAEDMARPEQEFNRRNTDFQQFLADTMLGKSSTDTQSAAAGESPVSKPAAEDVRALFNERGNLNASAIDTLVSAYEAAGANQDVVSYVHDAEQAYTYGKYGMNMEVETKENKLTLSPAQAEQAYRLGKLFSGKETSTAIAKVKQRVFNETQAERGAVRFEYDTQRTKLTAREQTSVDVLSGLAQAYNLKLSFFESTMEDGKRVYKMQDGKTVSAPNGYYASKDGTIHIDVHAGQAGQGVVMYTAAHELTHFIRQWSPDKFKTLANFLVAQYGEKGKSVDYYVRAQMQKAKKNGRSISYDKAFGEFVADSMETMLADGRVAEKLRALKEQDKSLWQKVKDFFKDFAANLKKLVEQYKDAAPDSEEGKFVASLNRDVIEKLEDLFTEGVVGASENFSRANVEGGKEVAPIEAGEPASPAQEVEFSIRLDGQLMEDSQKAAEKNGFPFDYEEVRTVRNTLVDMLNGVEWTDAKGRKHKAITGLNLPADKISTEYAGERSAPGNRKKIKKGDFVLFGNASYGRSAENTSVCIRSIMNDAIVEQVELALGRKLSITESLYVTQQIANYTDIPQCVYCYVAADRAAYNQMLGQFLNDRPKVIQAQQEGKTLDEAIRMISKTSKPTKAEINRATLWYNAARDGNVDLLTKESDYAGVMYSSESEAKYRAKLKNSLARQEYDLAVRYASNASHAKKRVAYTAYDGAIADPKIMTQKLVDILNSEYGLRMYSYSDFSPAFILENVQMITDAAARGLKMLAYTKELDFVKLFAPTGMNINISVFGMQNPDADGNFHQDAMWGADWAEAQKLRSQYGNVGCTFVATSDAQVEWAMQQDWIDVVIPYHSVFAGGTTVGRYFGYTDYKSVQADAKSAEHRREDAASVYPPEHQNDIVKYVEALGAHHLQPRFAKWITGWREYLSSERTEADKQALRDANPYYMKLVNETRRSAAETPVVKPEFGGDFLTMAGESLQTMARKGGYAPPFAQDIEEQTEFAKEIAGRIEEGEALDHDVLNPKPERTGIRVNDAYAALGGEDILLSARDSEQHDMKISDVTQTQQFKRWFGDWQNDPQNASKVVNADGTPRVVYHQTGSRFTVFNTDNPSDGLNDSETPNGIFFKQNDHDIGVGGDYVGTGHGGDIQMPVYLRMTNPLHFANRKEARAWYDSNIEGYRALREEMDAVLKPLSDQIDELDNRFFFEKAISWEEHNSQWNELMEVLREKENSYRRRLRRLLDDYFLGGKSGYDGIELDYDGHRYIDGRREDVHTYIVFDGRQVKSATDNIGTFDPNNPDIRYSDRDASPDTDYAAEVKRMQEEEYSKLKAAYEKLLREVSVKDTLRSENAALRERVAGLQETLKGMTAPALNPEDVRKYVRSLKKTYMSDVDSTELAVGISKLWHMMADLDAPVSWDALYARATELGRRVIEGASLHALNADPRLTAMQAAYDYFSGNPKGKRKILKISPEDAAEFGYMQGTGKSGKRVNTQEWSDTRKVFAAHGINLIVGTGNTLDDNWYEAAELFPEFFENDIPSQDELRAVMGFLNEYDVIRDQKAVEVLGGEDIDNMAAWVANNIMDTLNPGLDENGNAKKDAIRQSKFLMQQSEQEMYRQISMHQARLNRVYNREIKRLTAENTAAKQQIKDLGAKIKANARTYSAEISRRDVQLRDQIIQYEKEIDQLTRRKDAELESSQRAHGDDIVRYEKAIERLNEKIAAAKQQQNELRQQKNAQIEELRKQKNAEKREAVQKVKESYSRKQQSQKISDVLARIADRLVGAKKKPQTKQGVKSLAETVLTQAEDFFKGNSVTDAKTMLNGIADAYADTENAGPSYIEGAFRQEVHDNLTELANDLAGKSAKDLTAEELHDIYKALRAVEVSINRAGYLFGKEAARRVEDSAAKAILEIENQRQAKAVPKAVRSAATAAAYMYWADLKPIYAMRSINSTELSRLFNAMLYDGQATWTKDVERGREAMLNASQKYGFSKWNLRETHEFTDKYGEKIFLNLEQMMYLYACVRRGEQAVNHLTNGGFVFGAPVESKKGKLTYMVRDARAHALTVEELIKIRDTLTDSQRMFVEELQDYLSTVCAADGNGVSMELYGIDMFGEPNYIPVMSAGNFHSKAGEVQFEKEFGVGQKLTGRSFTKRTVKNANNPILLQDFTDVVRGHISDMAQYHAFAVPLTNFQKVFSWAEKQTDSGNRKSVRSALENRFGSDAPVRYLNILLSDLNNSARRDPTETLFDRGLSVFKRSAVAFSLSVAVQQPSAIARTLYVLNPRYFAGAKVERAKAGKTWEQLCQYSSTARLKDIGGFDVGMKGSTEDYIFHRGGNVKDTLENGLHTASGFLPEVMDKITWCTIWNAVKREVRHKYPRLTANSEAFLSMAGRRFDEVVNLTQVYDSTLTRSQAMRSRTTYMKSITAFMAEPTTGLNMLLDGLRRGGKAGAAAVGAWTASAILNAVLASVIYAGRDDDEDKTYLEKYLKSLSNEVLDGLNPLTAIPLVQDIWNLIQGWDADRADLSVIADIITNVKRAASKILKGDELAWKDYENSIGLILQAFGIPAKNISRDVRAVFQTVLSRPVSETQWYEILSGVLPAIFPDERGSKLYYAVTSGNSDYLERLKSGYKDEVSYHSAIRAALRKQDPRIAAAAEAYRDNDIAEYKRLVSAVKADGFIQDDVVSAVISTYNELIKAEDERSYTEGKVSMYTTEHYVTSLAQGLGMENEIFDELVRAYHVKNADKGYTQEEADTNVRKSIMSAVKEAYVETGVLDREKALEALNGWMDADKAEETLKQWDYSKSVGAEWDDRYSTYYEAITEGTGDASKIKAEILKAGVEEKYIQQKVVDRVEDDYSSGRMTAAEAQKLLKQYGGLEAEETQTKINVWDYMGRHPDSALQADDISLFFTKYRELGVPESNFEDYLLDVRACKGTDSDGDGRAENGTKKAQVMEVIDALPVSSEVKDALYFAEGYKASTLYEAPWH